MVETQGMTDMLGAAIGLVERRVHGDLDRFKQLIEERRGEPTGAWRGTVDGGQTT
jgi:hypothetical protein